MKVIILAGGLGTRLSEETISKPKPMVEIGGKPIIEHIMEIFYQHNFDDFVVCLGWKGEEIKKYFLQYTILNSSFKVNLENNNIEILNENKKKWKVTLLETGLSTMTGGRIKRAVQGLGINEPFFMTYGDGVGNVDISNLLAYHKSHEGLATVTSVTPPGRFGILDISERGQVKGFREKIAADQYKVNAGFFVLDPKIIDYIDGDKTVWEKGPMRKLSDEGLMYAFEHKGFWQPMDTLRDKDMLNELASNGTLPWII